MLLVVLRRLVDPTPDDVYAAVECGLSMDNQCYGDRLRAVITDLWYSPALTHRDRPWRTDPAHIDGDNAWQRVIFTNPDSTETACLLHLVKNQRGHNKAHWFTEGILADDPRPDSTPPDDTRPDDTPPDSTSPDDTS
jgi:hypothetical protein